MGLFREGLYTGAARMHATLAVGSTEVGIWTENPRVGGSIPSLATQAGQQLGGLHAIGRESLSRTLRAGSFSGLHSYEGC